MNCNQDNTETDIPGPMRLYQVRDDEKAVREKQHITHKGSSVSPATDFSQEATAEWGHETIPQAEKEKIVDEEY